jgi:hypothetical protein
MIDEGVASRLPAFALSEARVRGELRSARKFVWRPLEGL